MTPQEKAAELLNKMFDYLNFHTDADVYYAKKCALIAVDEIIFELESIDFRYDIDSLPYNYWQEVKQEIEKL
jgi:hypothetical protein